jgi:hypothetical protein
MFESKTDTKSREELYNSLFTSAQTLGIIPPEFSQQDFTARFFYLFIELSHRYKDKDFNEYTFDNENNYSLSMLIAFDFVFRAIQEKREFDFELLDKIHELAVKEVTFTFEQFKRVDVGVARELVNTKIDPQARCGKGLSFIILINNTSSAFLEKIKKNRFEVRWDSFDSEKGDTTYYPIKSKNVPLFQINRGRSDVFQDANFVKKLIAQYNKKIATAKTDDEKLKIIGDLIGDLDNFHLYLDGNGRTHDFLLANYLLIKEGLTPCMIFQPWHYACLTSEQRVIAIKDGQEAYRQYFLQGRELTAESFKKPITAELQAIQLPEFSAKEMAQINQNIIELAKCFVKIQFLSATNQDIAEERQKLTKAVEFLDSKSLDQIGVFCLCGYEYYAHILSDIRYSLSDEGYNIDDKLVDNEVSKVLLRDRKPGEDMTYYPTFGSVVGFVKSPDCQQLLVAKSPGSPSLRSAQTIPTDQTPDPSITP